MDLSLLFDLLNKRCNYAVLRNYELLPRECGRDIDILIDRKDFFAERTMIIDFFVEKGYKLFQYYKGSEMHSLVFAKVCDGDVDLVSFDFLFSIYVRDLVLFNSKDVLAYRKYTGQIYIVREDFEFLSKYLYNRALKEGYPDKYSNIQKITFEKYKNDISKVLIDIFGTEMLDYKDDDEKNIIRYCWNKHLATQIKSLFTYFIATLSNVFCPQGISISFTGPDGVGKTTVIDKIILQLQNLYKNVPLFHFRPLLIGNLGEVAHNVGLKKEVDREYTKPHRGHKVGVISSLLRLCYYTIDYILGYYKLVKGKLFRRNIVIFDRYYTDVICDSRRSRIFLNYKFLYWFGKVFIPRLDYNILLTARTETILGRKQELTREGIEMINDKIDYLATKKGYKKVMNEGTAEEAVTEIFEWVFEEQHKRNLKRLK